MEFPVKINGSWVYLNPFESRMMMRRVLGRYEQGKVKYARKIIEPGDYVVDAGANHGFFTVLFSRLVGEKGKVDSFEPFLPNFKSLEKTVALNGFSQAWLHNVGLSDENGFKDFYPGRKSGWGSLIKDNRYRYNNPIRVSVKQLSLFQHKQCKLLKMDCEGNELRILRGARLDLIDNIIMDNDEVKDRNEIIDLLEFNGFKVMEFSKRKKDLLAVRV